MPFIGVIEPGEASGTVAAVTAFFHFVNRLVLGLGAVLEQEEERSYDY